MRQLLSFFISRPATLHQHILRVTIAVVVWKLLLTLILASSTLSYRPGQEYTQLSFFTSKQVGQAQGGLQALFESWANFDGVHYIAVATRGYVEEARFLPLYPILITVLSTALKHSVGLVFFTDGQWQLVSGWLISHASLVALLVLFEKWLEHAVVSEQKMVLGFKLPTLLLLIFPTSFFFGSIYTESLFALVALCVLYGLYTRRWWLAAVGIIFASGLRVVGVTLLLPFGVAWLYHFGKRKWNIASILHLATAIFGSISVISSYAYFNYAKWLDPLYFVRAHTELANSRSFGIVNPVRLVVRYGRILLEFNTSVYEWWVALLELAALGWFLGGMYLLYYYRKQIKNWWLLALFCISLALVPLLSGTLSGFPRYVLVLSPLYVVYAMPDFKWYRTALVVSCTILLVILTLVFSRGYFVA